MFLKIAFRFNLRSSRLNSTRLQMIVKSPQRIYSNFLHVEYHKRLIRKVLIFMSFSSSLQLSLIVPAENGLKQEKMGFIMTDLLIFCYLGRKTFRRVSRSANLIFKLPFSSLIFFVFSWIMNFFGTIIVVVFVVSASRPRAKFPLWRIFEKSLKHTHTSHLRWCRLFVYSSRQSIKMFTKQPTQAAEGCSTLSYEKNVSFVSSSLFQRACFLPARHPAGIRCCLFSQLTAVTKIFQSKSFPTQRTFVTNNRNDIFTCLSVLFAVRNSQIWLLLGHLNW